MSLLIRGAERQRYERHNKIREAVVVTLIYITVIWFVYEFFDEMFALFIELLMLITS